MQVPSEYQGREQSYLKHLVLKEYLGQWAHKLGSTARQGGSTRLWYVDAFAGPWKQRHPELRDTSFAIGLEALESAAVTWKGRGYLVELSAVCVEKDASAYAELEAFLTARSGAVATRALRGEFGDHTEEIATMLGRDPAFVFVDPLGWKDAAMNYIAPLAERGPRDVMVNVMFDHLNRQKDRAVEGLRKQMRDFFGLGDADLPAGLGEDDLFPSLSFSAEGEVRARLRCRSGGAAPHNRTNEVSPGSWRQEQGRHRSLPGGRTKGHGVGGSGHSG